MKRPISLWIVAGLFVIAGLGSVWDTVWGVFHGQIIINGGILFVFVGIGLYHQRSFWRYFELASLFLGFFVIVLLTGLGFFGGGQLMVFGKRMSPSVRPWAVAGATLTGSLLFGWMTWVLTRPSIVALFTKQ